MTGQPSDPPAAPQLGAAELRLARQSEALGLVIVRIRQAGELLDRGLVPALRDAQRACDGFAEALRRSPLRPIER